MKQIVLTDECSKEVRMAESRKERLEKKRTIRKNKILVNGTGTTDNAIDDQRQRTHEQKIHIQKVRNREAAQRSRQMHRKYVQDLEQTVSMLRKQLKQTHTLCSKCHMQIEQQASTSPASTPDQMQSDVTDSNNGQTLEGQEYSGINNFLVEDQPVSYERVENQNTFSPYAFFFILAVAAIAIFTFRMPSQQRILVEVQPVIPYQKIKIVEEDIADRMSVHIPKGQMPQQDDPGSDYRRYQGVVPINYKFSPFNHEQCLSSIINSRGANKNSRKLVHLRETTLQPKHNLLFCQAPKILRHGQHDKAFFSKLMNIIINGSEMVEILGGSPLEFSKVVQLDGIYRINAEVKEIEKVEDHNCLFAMT